MKKEICYAVKHPSPNFPSRFVGLLNSITKPV